MDASFLFAIVFVAGALFVITHFSERERTKRALRDATQYAVGEFPDGAQGKVVGKVQLLGEPILAPLSGRSCVYYSIRVEEYRNNGTTGNWYQLLADEEGVNFAVDDETGSAVVHVEAAKIVLSEDHSTTSSSSDLPNEVERAFLDRHSKKGEDWVSSKTLRYVEAVIEPGETVSVFGYGSQEPDPNAAPTGYRDIPPMRVRISGSKSRPAIISDIPSVH